MQDDLARVEEIFNQALGFAQGSARAQFLSQACGDNTAVRQRVEALLASHDSAAGGMLDLPHIDRHSTLGAAISEGPGSTIGRYKLLQQIGEGGFGVVFMADQEHPVRRRVALKIIKLGMDTRQVIARFEAERQALAMMEHPSIARVLDAGATETGRPYFVMELVKGVPITQYCDEHHLTPRDRLGLFVSICHAVQHAHQKGIIHRDLKPSNVLVAEYDEKPVPKVIDFGVAKAVGQQLTEKTMFTAFGQVIGTVEYMSPEHAKLNQLDIDTRSDVYSLGVILYELLTGQTPFDRKRLQSAAFDEMLRIIREEEPLCPSTQLSRSQTLPSVAANRHTEPAKLTRLIHGELDWIVMKCLEKDRARRYETANGLATDLQRYLADEPVLAGPPSATYRFQKFARRNKTTLATTAALILAAIMVAGTIGWAVRDRTARQARVSGQLESILDEVAQLERAEKWHEALMQARRAEPALATGEAAPDIQARARQALADLELVRRLEEIRMFSGTAWGDHLPAESSQTERKYMAAFREVGIDFDALPVKEATDRITARPSIAPALLPVLDDWVAVRSKFKPETARPLIEVLKAADPDPWRQQMREALARQDWRTLENMARSPDLDKQPAATLSFLCSGLEAAQQNLLKNEVLLRAQRKYPDDFWINHRLGTALIWLQTPNHVRDGIGFMRAAVAVRPQSAHAVMNLGNGYWFLRDYDQAIACYRRGIEFSPRNYSCYTNLGIVLGQAGQHEAAVTAFERAIGLATRGGFAETYAEFAMVLCNHAESAHRDPGRAVALARKAIELEPNGGTGWTALGVARYRQGQWSEAHTALNKSLELGTVVSGGALRSPDECAIVNRLFLAMSSWQLGQKEEARRWFDQAVASMNREQPNPHELFVFRAEAAELMLITPSSPTTQP